MGRMASGDPYGTLIKRARERRRLTQQDLADLLGVDRKTVDNWEHDRTFPRNRVGALEEWAPELAEDADPAEAELRAALTRLHESSLIEASDVDQLMARYRAKKRRARDGVRPELAS